mgnify:CR=1 FL=1
MIQKLTITKIFKSDKDKNGNFLKTKDGRAYSKLAIKTKEYGDKWISGFLGYWNENWVEGQIVGAVVEPNGDFLNLKKPDPVAELEVRVKELENQFAQFINQPQADEKRSPNDKELPF